MQALLRALRLLSQLRRLLLKMRLFSDRVAFIAAGLLVTAAGILAAPSDNGSRWWSYVEYLASDRMQGRQTGSPEHRNAAEYVAGQLKRDGLKPAGQQGYIQPVQFKTLQLDEPHSSLVLVRDGRRQTIPLGPEAIVTARIDPAPKVSAGLVFVGYGLRAPEIHYDDFAGLDTKGKIAVYMGGGPASISGALASHYSSSAERWKAFKSAGIVGAISIANPKHMDVPWPHIAASRHQTAMQLAAPGMNDSEGEQIAIAWNPANAEDLLRGTDHTLDELVADAEAKKPLPRFQIAARIEAVTAVKHGEVESQNIAAIWPGSDPQLKNQYVVMTAHIDHVGVGAPINGDRIYNGAMDDASGVASLLDIADRLRSTAAKTKRSLLFVAVTGEEKGLLGSKYFAAHPTVPAGAIVADINCDMFLPLFPLRIMTVYGLDESTLGEDVRAIAAKMRIRIQPDPEPARNVFIRSDQYSFILHGVPSLMLDFGFEKGSPEAEIHKRWLTERYHAPSDDLNQPVDKPAAAEFNTFVMKVMERVADSPAAPKWRRESFFSRFRATR
jgi:hypothetical protein